MKRDPSTGAPNFFSFARDYLHGYMPTVQRLSPKTIEAYRISLECFLDYLTGIEHVERAHVSFDHFERQHLKAWLAWMVEQRHYAPTTIALRLSTIKAFLAYSSYEDITLVALSQAAKTLKAPGSPRTPIEYLTEPETRAVLAAFTGTTSKSRRNRMLLILLYDTAARVGEITGLTLQDLCLAAPGHVTLTGKRNKTRTVPLTDKTINHLRVYLDEFHPNLAKLPATRPVFYSLHHGQPTELSVDTVSSSTEASRRSRTQRLSLDPAEHPLPHAAQDQGHGPLPAGHPATHHHAPPRPREHLDHGGVLRLRHLGHDATSNQRSHPRNHHPGHRTAHRRQTPRPLQPPVTPNR